MKLRWPFRKKKRTVNQSYQKHKEETRKLVHSRLIYWSTLCEVNYKRVAIRDTKRSWGSCSSLGNLNFSYKLIFLPRCLQDYIIVHELCHLRELNHSEKFWFEVEKILPEYKQLVSELRLLEKNTRTNIVNLEKHRNEHTCLHCTTHDFTH